MKQVYISPKSEPVTIMGNSVILKFAIMGTSDGNPGGPGGNSGGSAPMRIGSRRDRVF